MIKLGTFRSGIVSRLVSVVLIPSFLLFIAIITTLYYLVRNDAIADVEERAKVSGFALAQNLQYGIVSGNSKGIENISKQFLAADTSIAVIEIFDVNKKLVTRLGQIEDRKVVATINVPILREIPNVDLFDQSGPSVNPNITTLSDGISTKTRQLGVVRIFAQADTLINSRSPRLLIASLVVLLMTAVCTAIGLLLGRRLSRPLRRIINALNEIKQGKFNIALPVTASGELGDIEKVVNSIAVELGRSRSAIEAELAGRMRDLIVTRNALEAEVISKGKLFARTNLMIEEERRKLSHEIHDRLNASLISIRHAVTRLSSLFDSNAVQFATEDVKQAAISDANRMEEAVVEVYKSSRSIVKSLRPELLDTLGLEQALRELIGNYEINHPDCSYVLEVENDVLNLGGDAGITAYRVVQECLTNVTKHSMARNVVVTAKKNHRKSVVTICVRDDGVGFDVEHPSESWGIGLIGMRERAEGVGGHMRMSSSDGTTKICLDLPWALMFTPS
jgi:two-component system, NarL family, sensor histidine kinase UhpB